MTVESSDPDLAPQAVAAPSKARWSTPTLVHLDVSLSETVLNAIPDGDTSS